MKQLNNCYNAHDGSLDLVLAGSSRGMVNVMGVVEPLVPINLSHPPLEVNISIPKINGSIKYTQYQKVEFLKSGFLLVSVSISAKLFSV